MPGGTTGQSVRGLNMKKSSDLTSVPLKMEPLENAVKAMEAAHLVYVCSRCATREEAAYRLGVSSATLWRKMTAHNVNAALFWPRNFENLP